MVRSTVKHSFTKSTVVLALVFLLAVALTVDFLWASMSSTSSIASSWTSRKDRIVVIPNAGNHTENKKVGSFLNVYYSVWGFHNVDFYLFSGH